MAKRKSIQRGTSPMVTPSYAAARRLLRVGGPGVEGVFGRWRRQSPPLAIVVVYAT